VATEAICSLEGSGSSALIGRASSTTPSAAALLNSAYVQGFELDDYHPAAPLHSGALAIPAMLSASSNARRRSGAAALLGAVLCFEVGPRVGLALHGGDMLARGWHSGPIFGGPAAAVAAGALYGLDAAGYEDALGLGATQAGGLMAAQFEAMSKRMQHGFAARNGLLAATLAAARYTGIKRVFEREYGGFLSTFGEGHDPDPEQVAADLGERWETERIAVKPYAAMAGLHAGIDAARQLLSAADRFDCEQIDAITIDVANAVFHHGGWRAERPLTVVGAQMNLAYAVAVTLLDGTALMEQFSPRRVGDDDVWRLIDRTTVRHDQRFDQVYEDGYNTRLGIVLRDGAALEVFVEHPRGGLASPLSDQEIVEKFRLLTTDTIEPIRAGAIEAAVLNLEQLEDIGELVGLLAATALPAFAGPTVEVTA
jgi:2-methylcitrate dehydratase PrpD